MNWPPKAAVLMISTISSSDAALEVELDLNWTAFDLDKNDSRWSVHDQVARMTKHRIARHQLEPVWKTMPIRAEAELEDVSEAIWALFPVHVQKSLAKFDEYARDRYAKSASTLPLLVVTDVCSVPWELCATGGNGIPWARKFMTAVIDPEHFNPAECPPSREGTSIEVVLQPFDELFDKDMMKEFADSQFREELGKLKKVIQETKVPGVEVTPYERPMNNQDFRKVQDVLRGESGNLVLYLGAFEEGRGIPVSYAAARGERYYTAKEVGKPSQAIFLDASLTSTIHQVDGRVVCDIPRELLGRGICSYMGTLPNVHPLVTAVVAREFLESLLKRGSSLCEAMYDGRTRGHAYCLDQLKNQDYAFQCNLFSLYGLDTNVLESFLNQRDLLSVIYSEAAEPHFEGFRDSIFPSSISGIKLIGKKTLEEVQAEVESTSGPFIADMSILGAASMILRHKQSDPLVIIGALVRLKGDVPDAILYVPKRQKPDKSFWCCDARSFVTIMAMAYSSDNQFPVLMTYAGIEQNVERLVLSGGFEAIRPFVLAGDARRDMETFVNNNRKALEKCPLKDVALYQEFRKIVRENSSYYSDTNILGEVLIARKSDVEGDPTLYRMVLDKWTKWLRTSGKIPEGQELISSVSREDVEATKLYTQYVHDIIAPKTPSLTAEQPLSDEDFMLVSPFEEPNPGRTYDQLDKQELERNQLIYKADFAITRFDGARKEVEDYRDRCKSEHVRYYDETKEEADTQAATKWHNRKMDVSGIRTKLMNIPLTEWADTNSALKELRQGLEALYEEARNIPPRGA